MSHVARSTNQINLMEADMPGHFCFSIYFLQANKDQIDSATSPLLPKVTPGQTPSITPNMSRANTTIRNILTPVQARRSPVQQPNPNQADEEEQIQTVKVTDMTSAPIQVKSLGSLFSSINKSVSSALNSFMSLQGQQPTQQTPATGIGNTTTSSPQVSRPQVQQHPRIPPPPMSGPTTRANTGPPQQSSNSNAPGGGGSSVTGAAPGSVSATSKVGSAFSTMGGQPTKPNQLNNANYPQATGNRQQYQDDPPSYRQAYHQGSSTPVGHQQGNVAKPGSYGQRSRSPSPRRDIGFSAAVTNLVEQAHEIAEREKHGHKIKKSK